MLQLLLTAKSRPVAQQVQCIRLLARENLDLFDAVCTLLHRRVDANIFKVSSPCDRESLLRCALLAVVAGDIASMPNRYSRARHRKRLSQVCEHLDVAFDDVLVMQAHVSDLERLLEARGLATTGSGETPSDE